MEAIPEKKVPEKKIVFIGNAKMYYTIQRKKPSEEPPDFIVANVVYNGLIPQADERPRKELELGNQDKREIRDAERVFVVADTKNEFLEIVRLLAQDFDITEEKFVMVTGAGNHLKSLDTIGKGNHKVKIKELLNGKFIGTTADIVEDYIQKLYDSKQHEQLKKELADFRSGKQAEAEKAAKRSSGEASPKQRPLTIADEKVKQCKAEFDQLVKEAAAISLSRAQEFKSLALKINQQATVVEKEVAEYKQKLGAGEIERGIAKDQDHVLANTFESAVHWLTLGAEAFCDEIQEIKANPDLQPHEKIAQIKTAMGHIETLTASAERKLAKSDDRDKKVAKLRSFKISSKISLADFIGSMSVNEITPELLQEAKGFIQTARNEIADIQLPLTLVQRQGFLAAAAKAMVKIVHLESTVLFAQRERYAGDFNEVSREVAQRHNRVDRLKGLKNQAFEIKTQAEDHERVAVSEKEIFDKAKALALEGVEREVELDFAQIKESIRILENKGELDKPRIKAVAHKLKSNSITFQPVVDAINHLNNANDEEVEKTIIQKVENALEILNGIQQDALAQTTLQAKQNFEAMQASVDEKVGLISAQKAAAAKALTDITALHTAEAAKIGERVAFLTQPVIDNPLEQNAITRNVVAERDLNNAEVICIHFDANKPVFNVFWNEELVRRIKVAKEANPNVKILFLSDVSLQVPQELRVYGDLANPAVEVRQKIAAIHVDGFHISDPVFVENVEDFKAKAQDVAVLGSQFVAAPAPEMLVVDPPAAAQKKKNPHRGSLKDFKHARFERKAYLNSYFDGHGVDKVEQIDLDWMQLQLLSMEYNCETARNIRTQVGDQIERHSPVDQTKYRLVLDLLQLLDKEERRLKPKVITFFATAKYSEKYIAQREAKRNLILNTAEQVFNQLKEADQYPDFSAIMDKLSATSGHVAKAMHKIFERDANMIRLSSAIL